MIMMMSNLNGSRLIWPITFTLIYMLVMVQMPAVTRAVPVASAAQESSQTNRRYCSTYLFDAIRFVCNGRYNSLAKQYPESVGNFRGSTLKRLLPDGDIIYRPTFVGAAHECCRRPCGYTELRSYCAD